MRNPALLLLSGLTTASVLAAGCKGSGGGTGPGGPPGPTGPGNGPVLQSVTPGIASPATILELLGTGFSAVPGTNHVQVYGVELTVLSESPSRLLATGLPPPALPQEQTLISVEVAGVVSNPLALTLAPAGTLRNLVSGGLVQPRTLALDAGGTGLLVFDGQSGILHESGGTLSSFLPPSVIASPQAGAYGPGGLWVADSSRILVVATDETLTAKVTGLTAPPTAVTFDGSGNFYWVDGSNSVHRYGADGSYQPTFATVSTASGITFLGGDLYVTDPAAGTVSQVTLGGAVTPYASALPGARGITSDGTSLYVCVNDASGHGAMKVTGGAASAYAPSHPRPAGAAAGCQFASGALWALSPFDGGLERSNGSPWSQQAGELGVETYNAVTAGERLFLALVDRCGPEQGAVIEALADGSSRVALPNTCGANAMAAVTGSNGTATAVLVAGPLSGVQRLDLASGAVSTLVTGVGLNGYARAIAPAADGSFFVALDKVTSFPVVHYSADGQTVLASDVASPALTSAGMGLAVVGGTLFISLSDQVFAQPVAGGARTTVIPPQMGLFGIYGLSPAPGGVVLEGNGGAFHVDASGNVRYLGQTLTARAGWTFWNELMLVSQGAYPIARLQ